MPRDAAVELLPERPSAPRWTEWPARASAQIASGRENVGDCAVPAVPSPWARDLIAELAADWLAWQCRMIAGLVRGALYGPAVAGDTGAPLALWPGDVADEPLLRDVRDRSLASGRGVVMDRVPYGEEQARVCDLAACPLVVDGLRVATLTIMMSPRSRPQRDAALQLMQWGALWVETTVRRCAAIRRERSAVVLELLDAIASVGSCAEATSVLATALADATGCDRVGVGLRRGLRVRVEALSHAPRFDPRTRLVRALEAAMEESLDQEATLAHPRGADAGPGASRAQSELARLAPNGVACSVPLPGCSSPVGALTLERSDGKPFNRETIELFEAIASRVGPVLELRRRDERPLASKALERAHVLAASVLGPGRIGLKIAAGAVLCVVGALSVVGGEFRVTAPSTLEGTVRQAVVAPQDGYVSAGLVRAGDLVQTGAVMATLEQRELELERRRSELELEKHVTERGEALARRERTRLGILRARIDRARAELRLIDDKLERTRLRAPFDGVVVSGDLSQSIGAPVEKGRTLFEIAPLDSYRVVLEVDEHDIAAVEPGQPGYLLTAAMPGTSLPFTVERINPVAVPDEGRSFFRVEAALDGPVEDLRPGMQGVARVEVGREKLLWIWTHAVVDRLRLWAWSLGLGR